jgi:Glycosyltransferase family 87/WD40-like Beta Propeller Repeat
MTGIGSNLRQHFPKPVVIAVEFTVLVVLAGVFLWRGLVPAWKTLNTDFVDYYLAARLYRGGYPLDQIYDWTWVQRQKDHAGIERPIVAFTSLTPFSLLPALPFASLPPLSAKRGWLVLSLVLLGLTGWLLQRMSKLEWRRVAILLFLAVVPLRTSFLFGQQTVLLLFLFTLAAYLYVEHRPLASGLTLAVGGALKIWPAFFLVLFLRKKQWRASLGLMLGSAGLWLLSVGLFGLETVRSYLVEVLPWSLRGEAQDPYNINWNSFSAILHRLFIAEPELNPHPVAHLPALYCVLQPVCQGLIFVPFLWLMGSTRADDDREKLDWGTFLAMLLILSTQAASYDFVALILTAVVVMGYLSATARTREAAALVVSYGLVCFPLYRWVQSSSSGWHTLLAVPRLWAMTALWICLLAVSVRSAPMPRRVRLKSREAAVFGVIWLALVATATALNLLHMRHEFDNYAARLVVAPESYLDTDPVVAGNDVLFTMMLKDGYGTGMLRGSSLQHLQMGTDSFHPASARGSAWVELASVTSGIVRFPLDASTVTPVMVVVEARNAEKPSISADGRWLAFIRESNGRGSLWVRQLQPQAGGAARDSAERQISPADLDVFEAGFDPADEIVFSARPRSGSPALFLAPAKPGDAVLESAPAPTRYPAVSPDGHWLAFSRREGGNWQLWVRDLDRRAERRLTASDCNSTAPAWSPDSKHLVYATDCGRSLGLTALCRIEAVR